MITMANVKAVIAGTVILGGTVTISYVLRKAGVPPVLPIPEPSPIPEPPPRDIPDWVKPYRSYMTKWAWENLPIHTYDQPTYPAEWYNERIPGWIYGTQVPSLEDLAYAITSFWQYPYLRAEGMLGAGFEPFWTEEFKMQIHQYELIEEDNND